MRVFISVEPSENVKSLIHDFMSEVGRIENVKFVERDNLHITLLFLGELKYDEVEDVKEKLSFVSSFSKFTVKFKGTSTFGKPPRVVFVNPISRELKELGESIRLRFGIEEEFTPHLTIARIKGRANISKLLTERFFGECEISSVYLKKSILFPSGPIYSNLAKWDLK